MGTGEKYGQPWTPAEVERVVDAYFDARDLDLGNQRFVKTDIYREIAGEIGRTAKSVERKFQNISAVLDELGIEWIRGLPPLRNFQELLSEAIGDRIARLGEDIEFTPRTTGFEEDPTPLIATQSVLRFESPPKMTDQTSSLPQHVQALIRRFDPVARDFRNRRLGEAGEKLVLNSEMAKLISADREDLAAKVEWVSKTQGDGAGFDILSFDPGGREQYLEVKTTTGSKRTPFFMTRNEMEFSRQFNERYLIYRLYDFRRQPKAFSLDGRIEDKAIISPESYRISF